MVQPLSPPVLRSRQDKPLCRFEPLTQLEKTTWHFNTDTADAILKTVLAVVMRWFVPSFNGRPLSSNVRSQKKRCGHP